MWAKSWLIPALSVASLLLDSAFANAMLPGHRKFSQQTHEHKARAARELQRRRAELNARQESNATFRFYNDKTARRFYICIYY